MAGKTVQFSKFDTTYHDYYRSPSSSPDSTPHIPPIFIEHLSPHHSSTAHGAALPPPVSTVDAIERAPRTYPSSLPPSISTYSSSPESRTPHYLPATHPLPVFRVTDPSNLSVHKVLRHGLVPPINYNLHYSDESTIVLCPELTPSVLAEPASIPPVSTIVITCDRLPWHITITPKHSKKRNPVVTVADVLHKIYRELRQGLDMSNEDYGRLPRETQLMLRNAFEARCQLFPPGAEQDRERSKGLKCIDHLNMNTRFFGFVHIGEDNEVVHWKLEVAGPYGQSSTVVEESASDTSW